MENHLILHDLWDMTQEEPEKSDVEDDKEFQRKLNKAKIRIKNSLTMEYMSHVNQCKTPCEIWKVLQNLYNEKGFLREKDLRSKLSQLKKQSDQTADQYINYLVLIIEELRQIGINLPEQEVATIAMNGLPAEYNNLVTVLEHYHEKLTIAQVRKSLTHEEARLYHGTSFIAKTDYVNKPAKKEKVRCQYCHNKGHVLADCRKFKADHGITISGPKKKPSNKNKSAEVEDNVISLMAVTAELTTNDQHTWIIDSGASWHMAGHKEMFKDMSLDQHHATIEIADGTHLKAEGRGTVELVLDDKIHTKLTLTNVLYVPGLTANLLSVSSMTEQNASVSFQNNRCTIKKGNHTLQITTMTGSHYCLRVTAKTWHQRLGHVHPSRIKKLDLPHKTDKQCEDCI